MDISKAKPDNKKVNGKRLVKNKLRCPGLEYLKYVDTLLVMQTPEMMEGRIEIGYLGYLLDAEPIVAIFLALIVFAILV